MSAYVITLSNHKGGCSKTTSCAAIAKILSEKYKVLAIDTDGQSNLTELITQSAARDFRDKKCLLDAIKEKNAKPYILSFAENPNLHLLPANEYLPTFSRWINKEFKGNPNHALKIMLENVKEYYQYIIIDTPPALSDMTINCLSASDGVIIPYEAGKFCYSALYSMWDTIAAIKDIDRGTNKDLKILGILCNMIDSRRSDNKEYLKLVKESDIFGEYCFTNVITRKAATGRLAFAGIFNTNPELENAMEQYRPIVKEMITRHG